MTTLRQCLAPLLVFLQVSACASSSKSADLKNPLPQDTLKALIPESTEAPIPFTNAKIKEAGLPTEFTDGVEARFIKKDKEWDESTRKIVELNVFGFLAQTNYALHDTPRAHKKITDYLKNHRSSFRATHKKYGVDSSAIASLLWVETKHGKTMGTYPIAWVYYSLVMGSHPDYIKKMLDLLPEKIAKNNPKNLTLQAAQEKVIERCKSKATWALEELKALLQMQVNYDFNPFTHKASFAGAFGIPQFIPSTYLKSAVSEFRQKPDLFKHSDAIFSVAHFLQSNGWKDKDPIAEAAALYSYNHSKDYGAVILKLSQIASK